MKKLIISFCLISSFFLNASFVEIEVTDISQEGILHLAIYNSKETFESDKGDKPGPQEGIVGGVIEFVEKGLIKENLNCLMESTQLDCMLTLITTNN